MNYTILNLTDSTRSDNPENGDFLQYTYNNGNVIKKTLHSCVSQN